LLFSTPYRQYRDGNNLILEITGQSAPSPASSAPPLGGASTNADKERERQRQREQERRKREAVSSPHIFSVKDCSSFYDESPIINLVRVVSTENFDIFAVGRAN
jgi:hypothetical protein